MLLVFTKPRDQMMGQRVRIGVVWYQHETILSFYANWLEFCVEHQRRYIPYTGLFRVREGARYSYLFSRLRYKCNYLAQWIHRDSRFVYCFYQECLIESIEEYHISPSLTRRVSSTPTNSTVAKAVQIQSFLPVPCEFYRGTSSHRELSTQLGWDGHSRQSFGWDMAQT